MQAEPAAHNPQQGPVPQTPPEYQAQGYGWQPPGYNPQQGPVPQTPPGYVPPPGYHPAPPSATTNKLSALVASLSQRRDFIFAVLFLAAVVGGIAVFSKSGGNNASGGGNSASLSEEEFAVEFINVFNRFNARIAQQIDLPPLESLDGIANITNIVQAALDQKMDIKGVQVYQRELRVALNELRALNPQSLSPAAQSAFNEFLDELTSFVDAPSNDNVFALVAPALHARNRLTDFVKSLEPPNL